MRSSLRKGGPLLADTDFETYEPNQFVLTGRGTQLTYLTTSITGQPQLYYDDGQEQHNFSGEEINQQEDSVIGKLATVTLAEVPDAHSLTLTLLVPQVNLKQDALESSVSTFAVLTTHRSHFGGPKMLSGPLQTYEVMPFEGTASFVYS